MQKIILKNISVWQWVMAGLILLLLTWLLFFIFRPVTTPPADPMFKYLEHQNDSLMRENERARIIDSLKDRSIDSLQSVIETNSSKIKIITRNVETRIHTYDSWSPEQLEKFFSDRYK
jgi:hypothetical protein